MSVSDYTRIGRCSICGGDVMAFTGMFYMSTVPPGPPSCSQCGARQEMQTWISCPTAVEAGHDPVIQMEPRRVPRISTSNGFLPYGSRQQVRNTAAQPNAEDMHRGAL